MAEATHGTAAPAAPVLSKAPDGKAKHTTSAAPSVVKAEAGNAADNKAGTLPEDAAPEEASPKAHTPNKSVKEFAALTRKEREVRASMSAAKEKIARADAILAAHGKAPQDPDGWLKAGGLTYDDVVKHYAGGNKDAGEGLSKEAAQRAAQAEQRVADLERRLQERDERAVVADYVANIEKVVHSDPELELIREQKKYSDVYDLIDMHFQKNGEVLDIHEAAKLIEDELFEIESQKAKSLLSLKKIKRHLGLHDEEATPTQPSDGPPAKGTKTITNELTAASEQPAPKKPLTDEERWKAIVARTRAAGKSK